MTSRSTETSPAVTGTSETPGTSTSVPRSPQDETEQAWKDREVSTAEPSWTVATGQWEFGPDYLQQNSKDSNRVVFARDFGLADGEFVAEVDSLDGQHGQHLVWRNDGESGSNYYFFGAILDRDHSPTNFAKWGYFDEGHPVNAERIPLEDTLVSISKGETHTYRVRFADGTHEMSIDDHKFFSVTDRTHRTGTVGFHCGGKTRFQNVWFSRL